MTADAVFCYVEVFLLSTSEKNTQLTHFRKIWVIEPNFEKQFQWVKSLCFHVTKACGLHLILKVLPFHDQFFLTIIKKIIIVIVRPIL